MQRRWIWIGLGLTGLGLAQAAKLQTGGPDGEDARAVATLYVVLGLAALAGVGMLAARTPLKLPTGIVRAVRALPRR